MTNKYRIRSIAFVAILTCGMASAQQLRDTFRRVKSGVVVVRSVDPEHATSGPMSQVDEDGLGSGVLISTDGKVLTAGHLVEKEGGLTVEFSKVTQAGQFSIRRGKSSQS